MLAIGPLTSSALIAVKMMQTPLPVGDDPGNWLKRAEAFSGKLGPLWEETLISYPPVFPLLTSTLSVIFNDAVTGLKAAAITSFFLLPVTTSLLVYSITNNKTSAVLSSILMAFSPASYEMMWWGAYPNILALAIFPLTIHYMIKIYNYDLSIRTITYFLALGAILTLTHHLTASVYLALLITTMALHYTFVRKRNYMVYIPTLASLIISAAYIAYLTSTFYTIQSPTNAAADIVEKTVWVFKNPILLFSLSILALVGSLSLFSERLYITLILLVSWLATPYLVYLASLIAGLGIDVGRLAFFLPQPLITLSTLYIPNLREVLKIIKRETEQVETNGKEIVVELSVDKLIPTLLLAITLILTPLTAAAVNDSAYDYYDWLSTDMRRYGHEERLSILQWIKDNTRQEDVIVSEYHIGRWIEGYANRKTLLNIPISAITIRDEFYRSLLADAALTSVTQFANGYFKIDDTSPLAPTFTPLIHASTKYGYQPVIYLDESFIRFDITKEGRTWIEAPFNAPLIQKKLTAQNGFMKLETFYHTVSLKINMTVLTNILNPILTITINVKTTDDTRLNSAEISLFPAWGMTVDDFQPSNDAFTLKTGKASIRVTFDPQPLSIKLMKDPEFNQDKISVQHRLWGTEGQITIRITNLNTDSSYPRNWAVDVREELNKLGATYIVMPKYYNLFKALKWRPKEHQGPLMYIEDGLTKFTFRKEGHIWSEAPYNATVLSENKKDNERHTTYKTIALYIEKEIKQYDHGIAVTYRASPAENGVVLLNAEIPLWLAWGNHVYRVYQISEKDLVLITQHGSLRITGEGVTKLSYRLDERYRQPKIVATSEAIDNKVNIRISISPLTDYYILTVQYKEMQRPNIRGGDRLDIIGILQEYVTVFETENLAVLRLQ
ncbi:MAG: hypothetical protein QXW58_01345 [Thermosphaera sp.]